MFKSRYKRKIQELKNESESFQLALARYNEMGDGVKKDRQQFIIYQIEHEFMRQAYEESKKIPFQLYKHTVFVTLSGILSYSVYLSVGMPQKAVGAIGESTGAIIGGLTGSVSNIGERILNFGVWGMNGLGASVTPFTFSRGAGLGYAEYGKRLFDDILDNAGIHDLRIAICCLTFVGAILLLICADWFMENVSLFLQNTQSVTLYPGYVHYTKFVGDASKEPVENQNPISSSLVLQDNRRAITN